MPTITWDRFTNCLVSKGFNEEQEALLAELVPIGFVKKLRSVGLDPKSFKISIGENRVDPVDDKQMGIFDDGEVG